MKNTVFWDVTLCDICKNVSEERIASIIRVRRINESDTANAVPSSLILVTLMMQAIRSFETSVLPRLSQRHSP
jgi:hypothetical protein